MTITMMNNDDDDDDNEDVDDDECRPQPHRKMMNYEYLVHGNEEKSLFNFFCRKTSLT